VVVVVHLGNILHIDQKDGVVEVVLHIGGDRRVDNRKGVPDCWRSPRRAAVKGDISKRAD
jgi:hypothetical protein